MHKSQDSTLNSGGGRINEHYLLTGWKVGSHGQPIVGIHMGEQSVLFPRQRIELFFELPYHYHYSFFDTGGISLNNTFPDTNPMPFIPAIEHPRYNSLNIPEIRRMFLAISENHAYHIAYFEEFENLILSLQISTFGVRHDAVIIDGLTVYVKFD
jgi:hypothetical protein